MTGEKIYSYDLEILGMTDYGLPLPSIVSGQSKVPPQGARVDVAFEGLATGRLTGSVKGVDYLRIRADGRIDLDIRATIETTDGYRIALSADGVGTPRATEPVADPVRYTHVGSELRHPARTESTARLRQIHGANRATCPTSCFRRLSPSL